MIASPDYIYAIYDGDGSAEIEHFFEAWLADNGLNSTAMGDRTTRPSSATASRLAALSLASRRSRWRRRRCPGGEAGVATDVNYHQASDTVANLNLTAFEVNTKAIAGAVAMYAKSFESLPPKSLARRGINAMFGGWGNAQRTKKRVFV
jgi:hypothetical protein